MSARLPSLHGWRLAGPPRILGAGLTALVVGLALPCAAIAHSPGELGLEDTLSTRVVSGERVTVAEHGDPFKSFSDGRNQRAATGTDVSPMAVPPATCPVVDRVTDDRFNVAYPPKTPVIKVIYAHPTDVGNRLQTYAPVIQAGVKSVADFATSESGGTQSVRFDVGNFEGAGCLDIQRVTLPRSSADYLAIPAAAGNLIATDVINRLGIQGGGPRNLMIYADGVAVPGVGGVGERYTDDSAAGTFNNLGGLISVVFGRGGTDFFGSAEGFGAGQTSRTHLEIVLHELSHNLGAVQETAPNSSLAGHCNEEWDLMCYDDEGPGAPFLSSACDGPNPPDDPYGPSFEAWDCGKDDYFNPSPAAGSYLATNWNLARSVFMCPISECNPADHTAPETTIQSAKLKKKKKLTITFEATERSAFTCRLDRRPQRSCASPFRTKVKRGKKHVFRVQATDQAGNQDLSPAALHIKAKKKR
jgi:hypothetical protein